MQELKPCPFCGEEAKVLERKFLTLRFGKAMYFKVRCRSVKCRLFRACWHFGANGAIEAWNRRVDQNLRDKVIPPVPDKIFFKQ